MEVLRRSIVCETLNREAKLYIGLPDDYHESKERLPVLYMHDGNNLFIKEDSFAGTTWKVKEAFKQAHMPRVIVVALSSAEGEGRLDEYAPFKFSHKQLGAGVIKGGYGDVYLDYIVSTLKPMIDDEFRTKTDAHNTYMMGSSLGGVISLYAALKYSHIFGAVASLSGAFFVSVDSFLKLIEETDFSAVSRIYLDTGDQEVGGGEPKDYINANNLVYQALKEKLPENSVRYKMIPEGIHHETAWAERFPSIVKWLIDA